MDRIYSKHITLVKVNGLALCSPGNVDPIRFTVRRRIMRADFVVVVS